MFVRLAVHVEYYCCGDGYPVGQFRYELVTVEAARCRAEATHGCLGIRGMRKIDGAR